MSSPSTSDSPLTAAALVSLGRHPGPFTLALDDQNDSAALVQCEETIRAIPGKRLVCRGRWQARAVYVKVYFDADKHWQAECHGLQALQQRNIATAELLHTGVADHGELRLIILAAIAPAQTLAQAWQQSTTDEDRIDLLGTILATLASHHQAGLEQHDIHLNNFLLADNQLYTLDGGGIRIHGNQELSVSLSAENLARFFAQLYPRYDDLFAAVLPGYLRQRGWDEDCMPVEQMRERIARYRHLRQRQFLKKIFRDCSAFQSEHHWRSFRVSDRAFHSAALQTLLDNPDASLQLPGMRYLKQGNSSTLWTVPVDGHQLVIKRYNIKGFFHCLSRACRPSRAAVSWKNAHRLAMYGILGARPVALCEQRFGPMRGKAWLVMQYIEGEDISRLCDTTNTRQTDIATAVQHMTTLLTQLADCRITHGDMKGTNFIQTAEGIAVIDLDAMREHGSGARFQAAQQKDMQRFMRNWEQCPAIAAQFEVALQTVVTAT